MNYAARFRDMETSIARARCALPSHRSYEIPSLYTGGFLPGFEYLPGTSWQLINELCALRVTSTAPVWRELVQSLMVIPVEFATTSGGEHHQRQLAKQAPVSRALRYSLRELSALVDSARESGNAPMTRKALHVAVDLLSDTLTRSSIYPGLSDDGEGGLFIEWWANDIHLSAEIDSEGNVWIIRRDTTTGDRAEGSSTQFLREELASLSDLVNQMAPDWRERLDGRSR